MSKINELLNKENGLYAALERCKTQVKYLRFQIKEIIDKNHLSNGVSRKAHHYQQLFTYYQKDLIPALEETIRLGKKHIELTQKNPDKSFKPVRLEVKNQFKLMRQFFTRFEQIKDEFETFTAAIV